MQISGQLPGKYLLHPVALWMFQYNPLFFLRACKSTGGFGL
jgi:hypothetical protein